jgi:hypothetical protein
MKLKKPDLRREECSLCRFQNHKQAKNLRIVLKIRSNIILLSSPGATGASGLSGTNFLSVTRQRKGCALPVQEGAGGTNKH